MLKMRLVLTGLLLDTTGQIIWACEANGSLLEFYTDASPISTGASPVVYDPFFAL